ncbi:M phase phosphoprotein 10-like protein [Drosera capensis]
MENVVFICSLLSCLPLILPLSFLQKKENLSTYEKLQERIDAEVKEMEKANLEPKAWTMTGEVTAAKRPKNSALDVDIDFEHNARPPPLITEEDTLSLEELIKKRVLEGNFDDVRRAPKVPLKAPKKVKELDENKSKKGLAELYEGEFAQQTGFISAPLSRTDLLKKETDALYKRLCLKLDALSHFHFAPKPVIEDMSIPVNLPALAMEEIMPVAVSDAAMLAPEEVFAGKGVIKDESELTKSDRKQRRAKKKRKFKAEQAKKLAKKARYTDQLNGTDDLPRANATTCRSFCGNLTIDYPFSFQYGCGHPRFQDRLYCINEVLMLHRSSGSYRVVDIDYAYQSLTLHEPHLSTCNSLVLGGQGNGFVIEPSLAPYLNPVPDNGARPSPHSSRASQASTYHAGMSPAWAVRTTLDAPLGGPLGQRTWGSVLGSGPMDCCAVSFGAIRSRLDCQGCSSAYSLAPLRVEARDWSFGIRVKYSVEGSEAFCEACEATGGTCSFVHDSPSDGIVTERSPHGGGDEEIY